MKKIFLFILFCLSVCSMSAYDFLRAVKEEIPGGYNFWVYTPVDYFYSQEHTPVIIFLHGASLCGRNLDKVRRYGPLDAIVKGRDIDALTLINIIEGAEVFAVNIQYGKKKMKNCHFHRNISILSIFFRTFAPSIKIKKIQFFK